MISAKAISKVILSGEHAVVHGYPAIALPVFDCNAHVTISDNNDRHQSILINAPQISKSFLLENYKTDCNPLELTVLNFLKKYDLPIPNINLEIKSDIPIASGMGSGAAISTAIIKGLKDFFKINISLEEIYDLVYDIEKIYHGNPSGIDPKVIVYESPFYFIRNVKMEKLNIKAKFDIIIIDSKIKSTTKEVVEWVGEQKKLYPEKYNKIFQSIGNISNKLRFCLENNDIEHIGTLINDNHKYLQEIGISNPTLDHLVEICNKCGALGSKLSGAGKGGIVIALIKPENSEDFVSNLKSNGIKDLIISK